MASKHEWIEFAGDEDPIRMLVAVSRYYGADPDFILAGGGNTSMKTPDRLYVKCSGQSLADIEADGFVEMDRAAIEELLHRDLGDDVDERERLFKEAILAARTHPDRNQRPSVECVLHHLMPGRFVVHSHPWLVNAFTCCTRGEALSRELFGDAILWMPFVHPGFVLARTVHEALARHAGRAGAGSPAVLMQNHGLIVSGGSPDEIRRLTNTMVAAMRTRLERAGGGPPFGEVTRPAPAAAAEVRGAIEPVLRAAAGAGESPGAVVFDDSETVLQFVGGADAAAVAAGGPLSPDQIVYCKSFPLWFAPAAGEPPDRTAARLAEAIGRHRAATQQPPRVVLVRGVGLLAAAASPADAENARALYVDAIRVMAAARRLGGIQYMTEHDRDFIEHWEVESYRRKVARN